MMPISGNGFLKRGFDIFLSSVGLLISLPLWVIISLLIKVEDGGPVLYRQERIGRRGKIFKALKFRSMIPDAEKHTGPVQASRNDPRVTRVGRVLRKTAMDELPQLVNILRGDMSFVGPRALRPKEILQKGVNGKNGEIIRLEDISGFEERLKVRPGLTGLAQIFAPRDAHHHSKFRFDLLYVRKMNLWLDLYLIFQSFFITFRARWE
ncbi:MAG: sugar transferase [Acidobacteriota bacterium]